MDLATGLLFPSSSSRGAAARTLSIVALAGFLAACEKVPEEPGEAPPPEGAALVTNEHNYTSSAVLTPPVLDTAAGVNLTIRWPDLTIDMQCHDIDPSADIDKVALIRFRDLENEDAAAMLTAGELDQNQVDGYLQYDTKGGETESMLTDLSVFGSPVDVLEEYAPSETQTYMLLWGSTTTPGVGARTMTFLRPTEDSDVVTVNAPIPCNREEMTGILDFSATFSDQRVEVPADPNGVYFIDWSDVSLDSLGNEFAFNRVTDILLGFYPDMTPADLQERILDIELITEDIWEGPHEGGKNAALSALKHRETGDAFTGFDGYGEGTWLFALRCSDCQNPSPLVLTILEPPTSN